MKKDIAALLIGKPMKEMDDGEEYEGESDGFDVAAAAVLRAIDAGDKKRFTRALKDAIEICVNS